MFLHTYNKQVKYSIKITFSMSNRNVSNSLKIWKNTKGFMEKIVNLY